MSTERYHVRKPILIAGRGLVPAGEEVMLTPGEFLHLDKHAPGSVESLAVRDARRKAEAKAEQAAQQARELAERESQKAREQAEEEARKARQEAEAKAAAERAQRNRNPKGR